MKAEFVGGAPELLQNWIIEGRGEFDRQQHGRQPSSTDDNCAATFGILNPQAVLDEIPDRGDRLFALGLDVQRARTGQCGRGRRDRGAIAAVSMCWWMTGPEDCRRDRGGLGRRGAGRVRRQRVRAAVGYPSGSIPTIHTGSRRIQQCRRQTAAHGNRPGAVALDQPVGRLRSKNN